MEVGTQQVIGNQKINSRFTVMGFCHDQLICCPYDCTVSCYLFPEVRSIDFILQNDPKIWHCVMTLETMLRNR